MKTTPIGRLTESGTIGRCCLEVGVALLEEVGHWVWAFRSQMFNSFLWWLSLSLLSADPDAKLPATSPAPRILHATMPPAMMTMNSELYKPAPNEIFSSVIVAMVVMSLYNNRNPN